MDIEELNDESHSMNIHKAKVHITPIDNRLQGLKVNIFTMGCSHNQSDSDVIMSTLLQSGAQPANFEQCNVFYVNSCTVKTPSQVKAI